jgi:hypothetical protein
MLPFCRNGAFAEFLRAKPTVVTRNLADFQRSGVDPLNPFSKQQERILSPILTVPCLTTNRS